MQRFGRGCLALAVSLGGCSASGISDPPPVDPGIDVGGLNFVMVGAGYTTATGLLPAADPTVAAPVVTLTGSLSLLGAVQLAVSAAEPFQAVLVLPVRWSSYARVAMPRNVTQTGIATARVSHSSFYTEQLQVAIVRGGKVSAPVTVSLRTPSN